MNKQKLLYSIILTIVLGLSMSCKNVKKINTEYNYFQKGLDSIQPIAYVEPMLKENDLISIQVIAGSSRQEDAALFNLSAGVAINNAGYQIDVDGNIELPKIGKIKAAGLTKQQLALSIQNKLVDEVKNPLVVIKFLEFKVNVLGEVKKPGVAKFRTEKVTVLDAIAEAGDLLELGKRTDIIVMRQTQGKYETYKIDLTSTAFINSPAYYLQQNDVIYVGANTKKLTSLSDENKDPQRTFQIIISSVSALALILNTIIILKRS
ncbi:MAG: polysaccharide biosynthesis/export family protein [Chitinophagaceae bacterium]